MNYGTINNPFNLYCFQTFYEIYQDKDTTQSPTHSSFILGFFYYTQVLYITICTKYTYLFVVIIQWKVYGPPISAETLLIFPEAFY